MPKGSRHVPRARPMASRNSAALSSSQCTDSLVWGDGGDGACAHTMEAQKALMDSSRVLRKGSSGKRGPRARTLPALGRSRQVRLGVYRLYVGFNIWPHGGRQLVLPLVLETVL